MNSGSCSQMSSSWKWPIHQQSNVCMQKVKMYTPVSPGIVWNAWPKKYSYARSLIWQSFQAYKLTYNFFKVYFFIACWFGNTYIWCNFFLGSVWRNFILRQKRIFCVNDAKTLPRLNTTKPNPFGKNQPWQCMCKWY